MGESNYHLSLTSRAISSRTYSINPQHYSNFPMGKPTPAFVFEQTVLPQLLKPISVLDCFLLLSEHHRSAASLSVLPSFLNSVLLSGTEDPKDPQRYRGEDEAPHEWMATTELGEQKIEVQDVSGTIDDGANIADDDYAIHTV